MRTVYFLGAGASFATEYQLPTMSNFFDKLSVKEFPSLSKFLEEYFLPFSYENYFDIFPERIEKFLEEKEDIIEGISDEFKDDPENISIIRITEELEKAMERREKKLKGVKFNLEQVVTFLDLAVSKFGELGESKFYYLEEAQRELIKYISNRLLLYHREKVNKLYPSEKYKILFQNLTPQDSVITLNYDIIIEDTLQRLWEEKSEKEKEEFIKKENISGKSHPLLEKLEQILINQPLSWTRPEWIYYTSQEGKRGVFLKLHGSINWVYCPNEDCRHHFSFFPVEIKEFIEQSRSFPSCRVCGTATRPAIVLPTMYKAFERFPKLGFIWALARKELEEARKIVIIGVSFAESDYYLKWLFKSALRKFKLDPDSHKIEVVDKNKDVCSIVEKVTGIKPEYRRSLEEYISSLD
ncbi:MAG: hypothetical protein J7J25_05625 [Candidatus Omnitrophica bacterium]|nr:hypothetical protein [Candidatus Omnitrophota bacterium]